MATDQYKLATDNDPNVMVTLISQGHRTGIVWAHPHNEPFYLPPLCQATSEVPWETEVDPKDLFRELTPDEEDPMFIKPSEPALQIHFSRKPKNPELGYLLGSDPELCDILLGFMDDSISHKMFTISLNQHNEVMLTSLTDRQTSVRYGRQEAKRRNFTWSFPPKQKPISVQASQSIRFIVETPTHETDKAAYEDNCRNFTICLSQPSSGPASSVTSTTWPFFLRLLQIGDGGFGVVYKARSMPDGRTVAIKEFKCKKAWTLEADVLKKLSRTPHDNIVEVIGFGLGKSPYLVMGLASGGNLAEQHKCIPFTMREIATILRQMLDALVYLHVTFNMIHRDIKPQNILCESRACFRLTDFGLAKEANKLTTFNGTRPYMAPEMFKKRPYTNAVDLWALGMVIAWLMYGYPPRNYKGDEGREWCGVVVSHFKEYEKQSRDKATSDDDQTELNTLVSQYMLKLKPEKRESAQGCQEKGEHLWHLLDEVSGDGSNATTQKDEKKSSLDKTGTNNPNPCLMDSGLMGKDEAFTEKGALADEREGGHKAKPKLADPPPGDEESELEQQSSLDEAESGQTEDQLNNDSEAETEFSEGDSPDSTDWGDLEREFPPAPRHFVCGGSVKESGSRPKHSMAPNSKRHPRPHTS